MSNQTVTLSTEDLRSLRAGTFDLLGDALVVGGRALNYRETISTLAALVESALPVDDDVSSTELVVLQPQQRRKVASAILLVSDLPAALDFACAMHPVPKPMLRLVHSAVGAFVRNARSDDSRLASAKVLIHQLAALLR